MLSIPGIGFTSFGPTELIIILAIILIIFGPKSLPSLGRAMGKGLREFKSASSKLSDAMSSADEDDDDDQDQKPRGRTEPRVAEPRQLAPPDRDRETAAARTPAHSIPTSAPSDET